MLCDENALQSEQVLPFCCFLQIKFLEIMLLHHCSWDEPDILLQSGGSTVVGPHSSCSPHRHRPKDTDQILGYDVLRLVGFSSEADDKKFDKGLDFWAGKMASSRSAMHSP